MTLRALALALAATVAVAAQSSAPPQNASIRQADLRADIFFYASDAMRGRLLDTPEDRIATEFIKSRFERLGLEPAAGDSYFQTFNLVHAALGPTNMLEIAAREGMTLRPVPGQDFTPQRFSGSARAEAEVVFAGFGISWPEIGHDDYPADVVDGRIVLVLNHEPGERDPDSRFEGLVTSERSLAWRKALAAQEKGAVGILFVDDVHNHEQEGNFQALARNLWPANPGPRERGYTLATWLDQLTIPAAQISRATAATLLRSTGRTLQELSAAAERTGFAPVPIPDVTVTMTLSVQRNRITTRNVLAMIEGSDAALRDEAVLLGAHLDHEGTEDGQVYNGADDNASGTIGLLEIAEAYALAARDGQRPRRTVIFAAWNAEEHGLLGSWAYTERPAVPLDRTVAVLNMDMIGRNQEIPPNGGPRFFGLDVTTAEANAATVIVNGHTRAPGLVPPIERAAAAYGLTLEKQADNNASNLLRRTDHWPFLHRGVPAIAFFTGLHPDYHTPTDTPDKINYEKLERIVRMIHTVSWTLANDDVRPRQTAAK